MTSYFSVHVQHRDIALLNCNDHILIWNFYFHQFIIHFIIYYLVFSPVSKIWHPQNSTNSLHLSFKYKVINPWWCFFESVFFSLLYQYYYKWIKPFCYKMENVFYFLKMGNCLIPLGDVNFIFSWCHQHSKIGRHLHMGMWNPLYILKIIIMIFLLSGEESLVLNSQYFFCLYSSTLFMKWCFNNGLKKSWDKNFNTWKIRHL